MVIYSNNNFQVVLYMYTYEEDNFPTYFVIIPNYMTISEDSYVMMDTIMYILIYN